MRRAEKAAQEGREVKSAFHRRVTARIDERTVPVGPILDWIDRQARIRNGGRLQLADELGMDDRIFRRLRKQPRVGIALVDRMLLLTDTNIRDLYPTEEVARA
jgi:chromosome condensin MukBEF complex kleisin-like MukF subunit